MEPPHLKPHSPPRTAPGFLRPGSVTRETGLLCWPKQRWGGPKGLGLGRALLG